VGGRGCPSHQRTSSSHQAARWRTSGKPARSRYPAGRVGKRGYAVHYVVSGRTRSFRPRSITRSGGPSSTSARSSSTTCRIRTHVTDTRCGICDRCYGCAMDPTSLAALHAALGLRSLVRRMSWTPTLVCFLTPVVGLRVLVVATTGRHENPHPPVGLPPGCRAGERLPGDMADGRLAGARTVRCARPPHVLFGHSMGGLWHTKSPSTERRRASEWPTLVVAACPDRLALALVPVAELDDPSWWADCPGSAGCPASF